jgi:hypothetical protein
MNKSDYNVIWLVGSSFIRKKARISLLSNYPSHQTPACKISAARYHAGGGRGLKGESKRRNMKEKFKISATGE